MASQFKFNGKSRTSKTEVYVGTTNYCSPNLPVTPSALAQTHFPTSSLSRGFRGLRRHTHSVSSLLIWLTMTSVLPPFVHGPHCIAKAFAALLPAPSAVCVARRLLVVLLAANPERSHIHLQIQYNPSLFSSPMFAPSTLPFAEPLSNISLILPRPTLSA